MRALTTVFIALLWHAAAAQTITGMPVLPQPSLGMQTLLDQMDSIRVTNEIDTAVDNKDWKKARSFFADDIKADFSSLTGQPAATMKADDLIKTWAANLGPKKASFHLRGNHLVSVEGDKATVFSHAYAWNRMEGKGDPLWEVWGNYVHELARTPGGWKVTGFTFVKTAERGNMWVKETPSPAN